MPNNNPNNNNQSTGIEGSKLSPIERIRNMGTLDAIDANIAEMFGEFVREGIVYSTGIKVEENQLSDLIGDVNKFEHIEIYDKELDDYFSFDCIENGKTIGWGQRGMTGFSTQIHECSQIQECIEHLTELGAADRDDEELQNWLYTVVHCKNAAFGYMGSTDIDSGDALNPDKLVIRKPGNGKPEYYGFKTNENGEVELSLEPLSIDEINKRVVGEPPKKPGFFTRLADTVARKIFGSKEGIKSCREYEEKLQVYNDRLAETSKNMRLGDDVEAESDGPATERESREQRLERALEGRRNINEKMARNTVDYIRGQLNDSAAEDFLKDLETVLKADNEQANIMRNAFTNLDKDVLNALWNDYKANSQKKDFNLENHLSGYFDNSKTKNSTNQVKEHNASKEVNQI